VILIAGGILLALLVFFGLGTMFMILLAGGGSKQVCTRAGAASYNALRERRLREEISDLEFVKVGYDIKSSDAKYRMTRHEIFLHDLYTRQFNGELGPVEVEAAVATQARLLAAGFKGDLRYNAKAADAGTAGPSAL
jgi:hypothetical protein